MKVLVTFAVEPEFAPWRARHSWQDSPGLLAGCQTRIGADEVFAVLTGIGPDHAAKAVRAALTAQPDVCISSGLAGALRPEHRVGEVLVARAASTAADERVLESAGALFEYASGCGAKPVERFYTSATLVRSAHEKSNLSLAADAVDMESYAILSAAADAGVPAVAVRAISDAADENLPYDLGRTRNVRGQISMPRLLAQVVRRPQHIPSLVRLGRQSRDAASSLARFLDVYIGALCTEWMESPVAAT
jgi:adenosylhomocysteine nucleosidase